jgi:hypothetical protein
MCLNICVWCFIYVDLQVLGVRRWRELATDRKKWQDIVQQDKPTAGCSANRRWRRRSFIYVSRTWRVLFSLANCILLWSTHTIIQIYWNYDSVSTLHNHSPVIYVTISCKHIKLGATTGTCSTPTEHLQHINCNQIHRLPQQHQQETVTRNHNT